MYIPMQIRVFAFSRNFYQHERKFTNLQNWSFLSLSLSLSSQLQCPYVVQLLGARVNRQQGVCALICEKMTHGCLYLALHVNKIKMNWSQRLHIVRDICSGMAFIHSHQILHRNLLPQNILVGHAHQSQHFTNSTTTCTCICHIRHEIS